MFGPAVPEHSIILLLSMVFCVIHPFVPLCGLAFFLMALVVESYNWGWVFRRPYEGGGELWKQVRGKQRLGMLPIVTIGAIIEQ